MRANLATNGLECAHWRDESDFRVLIFEGDFCVSISALKSNASKSVNDLVQTVKQDGVKLGKRPEGRW